MRSVLITGTSTGIGQATAVTLAARGWRVFATMRNLEKRGLLEQALKEAGVQNDVEIEQLDVTRHHCDPISRRIHAIANRQQA
jgi:NAD(P)-dependent dehydrogenase (short-subunit alcohol dehydrogenase family)